MKDLLPDRFVEAARDAGLTARLLPSRHPEEPVGVNVWVGEASRHRIPDTTVWWPRPNNPTDQIVWGASLDNVAHRDITAEGLVEKVKESLSPASGSGNPAKE